MLRYNKSVNRRGADQLPLKLPLKAVGSLADGYPFPSVPLEGSVCSFHLFIWYRVGGAPDYRSGFHGSFLSDGVERG